MGFRFFVLLTFAATCVLALDPTQPLASYIRTTFTVEDGLPSNVVNAILQTRNGFLWIGTDAGLARFDGRHFTPIDFRGPRSTPHGVVRALAQGPDGDLWVATNSGVARIPNTALDDLGRSSSTFYYPSSAKNLEITTLMFSRGGVLWAGTSNGLYRFERGGFSVVIPGFSIGRIEEASNGNLWVLTPQGSLEWDGSRAVQHPELAARLGVRAEEARSVFEDSRGVTWYCTLRGVARQTGMSFEKISPYGEGLAAFSAQEDPQGTVWVITSQGVFRATAAGLEQLTTPNQNRYVYADRDGDMWVGTNGDGLFRFKDRAVRMLTTADGLPSNVIMTVLASHEGKLWAGANCGGLSWFDGERFRTYSEKEGLTNSCVWALAEDANNDLWVGTWGGGLFRFREGHFTQYSIPQGLKSDIVRSIIAVHDGSLWLATADGLSVMRNGHFRNYTTADGLSTNSVIAVYQDRRGVIWAGTSGGIDRLTGDRFVPLPSALEISDPHYLSLSEGPLGDLYAFSAPKGIGRIEGNQLLPMSTEFDLMSMAEFQRRDLWFSGGNGIFRVAAADLSRSWQDRSAPLDYTSFGRADGLNSPQCSIGAPNMTITRDGKLWVATVQGLALVDLPRLPRTRSVPAIFVEEVTVGQKKQPVRHELVLTPGTHHVEVKFDSIEFVSPEKNRFQYRLDGVDGLWLDADTTHTAVYNSIPVGAHSLHIRGCNRDGVWDRTGIVYKVTQLPFFYETNVFRLAVLAGLSLFLWGLYRVRLHRIAREFNVRLEERVDERMRIARELHDTLLQSFQGSLMQMLAARNLFSRRPEQALHTLDDAVTMAEGAIGESRDAIQDLRSQPAAQGDLAQLLTITGQDLARSQEAGGNPVIFRLTVEGERQNLEPLLQDETYRIARELLRNAFRHAHARHIEAEIRYEDHLFRMRIRDDGKGIEPDTLKAGGLAGHFGLPGMRERAKRIGAQLHFWSAAGAGTEVELSIPSSVAYGATRRRGRFQLLRKKKAN